MCSSLITPQGVRRLQERNQKIDARKEENSALARRFEAEMYTPDVTVVLEWCYSGVTVVSQLCNSGVTMVLMCTPSCVLNTFYHVFTYTSKELCVCIHHFYL
jgi:hypothetical protein